MKGAKNPNKVSSDETLLNIIEYIESNGPAGVTEIATELDTAKSTVHAHLHTLYDREYVIKEDGKYELSLRILDMALERKYRNRIYPVIEPKLEELANKTGEQVWFWVEENGYAVVASQAHGENALSTNGRMGNHVGIHCTAGGKAILAHLPEERVESILDRRGLRQMTDNTITEREELYAELEQIREVGIAINRGENLPNVHAIGVPVIDNRDKLHGSISIAAPEPRLEDLTNSEHAQTVMQTAKELGINLTYNR